MAAAAPREFTCSLCKKSRATSILNAKRHFRKVHQTDPPEEVSTLMKLAHRYRMKTKREERKILQASEQIVGAAHVQESISVTPSAIDQTGIDVASAVTVDVHELRRVDQDLSVTLTTSETTSVTISERDTSEDLPVIMAATGAMDVDVNRSVAMNEPEALGDDGILSVRMTAPESIAVDGDFPVTMAVHMSADGDLPVSMITPEAICDDGTLLVRITAPEVTCIDGTHPVIITTPEAMTGDDVCPAVVTMPEALVIDGDNTLDTMTVGGAAEVQNVDVDHGICVAFAEDVGDLVPQSPCNAAIDYENGPEDLPFNMDIAEDDITSSGDNATDSENESDSPELEDRGAEDLPTKVNDRASALKTRRMRTVVTALALSEDHAISGMIMNLLQIRYANSSSIAKNDLHMRRIAHFVLNGSTGTGFVQCFLALDLAAFFVALKSKQWGQSKTKLQVLLAMSHMFLLVKTLILRERGASPVEKSALLQMLDLLSSQFECGKHAFARAVTEEEEDASSLSSAHEASVDQVIRHEEQL